jgi:hypothetical protein
MIKQITRLIGNLFTIRRPRFTLLAYEDLVIGEKAYFLVSWQHRNAYRLRVKNAGFRSYQSSGSAFILIPVHLQEIIITISSLWRRKKVTVRLVRSAINTQTEFFPVKSDSDLQPVSLYRPRPKVSIKPLVVSKQVSGVHIPDVSIKNLSKP